MKIEDIKVGMNVRRTKAMKYKEHSFPKGYTFTVAKICTPSVAASVLCDRGYHHDLTNLEPTDLETQLTATQAELDRIKAAIRDRDTPKVGDVITWGSGGVDYEVCAFDHNWLALRPVTPGPWERIWRQYSALNNFKIVSRASTS